MTRIQRNYSALRDANLGMPITDDPKPVRRGPKGEELSPQDNMPRSIPQHGYLGWVEPGC